MMMDSDLIGKEKTTTTTTISDLPEQVLTEVLVRLSAQDILACVCVQNSWHSLIKTRMFINLYSNYHHKFSSDEYLLFWDKCADSYWDKCADTYTIRIDDIQCVKYLKLKYPPHLSHDFEFQLVSNGLICLFDLVTTTTIHLWNPVIQKYITLPDAPLPTDTYLWKDIAFGFVPQIDDYVVVLMGRYSLSDEPFTNYIVTCVYSLSTKSWEKITVDHDMSMVDRSECTSVFVNGVAIWAVINEQGDAALVCFDTKTEMSCEISIPYWPEKQNPFWFGSLQVFNQSIAYFVEDYGPGFHDAIGVWILKGDPMNEFVWERKMMVELHTDVIPTVMGIRNNGEPILCNGFDLFSYYFDSHKSYDFVKSWNRWAPLFREAYDDWLHNEDGSPSSSPLEPLSRTHFAPFAITPFAESLGLLDVDCTQY